MIDAFGKTIPDGSQAKTDDPKCEKCAPLTLGTVVATALLSDRKDETGMSALDKAKRGALAMRMLDNKAAVLTPAQVVEIEKLLTVWPTIIITRALPMIDPTVKLDN
jgi:hypothetical protein